MNFPRSPQHKLIAAAVLMAVLLFAAQRQGLEAGSAARWALGLAALAGLGLWLKRGQLAKVPAAAPRLQVLSRTGLSQRCGLALVEADGRTWLVAYGDGFAEMKEAPPPARRPARKAGGR